MDNERLKNPDGCPNYFDELLERIRDIRASEKRAGDKDWRICECLVYFNSVGCKLALYNRDFGYGETF